MAIPRSELVDDEVSGFYHCMSRCVRHAFLLTADDDHRRRWIRDRLRTLSDVFAIDCVAMAIMENHLHLVLRTLPDLIDDWSDREVAHRWLLMRPSVTRRRKLGIPLDAPPQEIEIDLILRNPHNVAKRRTWLRSISWFMKELKEPIARRANREDGVTGRFWQDRFKSYRLLDEGAVLCCATYIDLNPVRAGVAEHALTARWTSVSEQLHRLWEKVARSRDPSAKRPDTPEEIEAFVRQFGSARLEPAMACRRECHLARDEHEDRTARAEARQGLREEAREGRRHQRRGGGSAVAKGSRRTRAPMAVMRMTLGDYFRRLAELSLLTVARLARSVKSKRGRSSSGQPGGRRESGKTKSGAGHVTSRGADATTDPRSAPIDCESPQAVLDGERMTPAALAEVLQRVRLWGSAVGSTSSLAREARRRGMNRVVCAMRS